MKLDPRGIEAALTDYYADPNLYPTDDIYTDSLAHEAMCKAIQAYCKAAGVVMVPLDPSTKQLVAAWERGQEITKEAGGKLDRDWFMHVMADYYRAMVAAWEGK